MKKPVNIVIVIALLLFPLTGLCQGDSYSLLTERYIDRPLSMHRGQLQWNSGYEFSSLNKLYDINGASLDLDEEGLASAQHLFPLQYQTLIRQTICDLAKADLLRATMDEHFLAHRQPEDSQVDHALGCAGISAHLACWAIPVRSNSALRRKTQRLIGDIVC